MARDLTSTKTTPAPAQLQLPTRTLEADLDWLHNHIEGREITVPIPTGIRDNLVARRQELELRLRSHHMDRVKMKMAVSYMLGLFYVGRNISAEEAEIQTEMFLRALADEPAYFVELATLDFIKHKVPDHDPSYIPNAAEICKQVQERATPFRAELYRINQVLSATLRIAPTKEETARIGSKFISLSQQLNDQVEANREARIREDRPRVEKQTDGIIERDWSHRGEEPIRVGGRSSLAHLLVSPSLADNIRNHQSRADDPTARQPMRETKKARR